MKTRIISLIAILAIASTTQSLVGQTKIKVEAVNDDISYYLDLKAVASIFGDARNLEEFENQLNDYDAQISNLDLNSDGKVDYLRVIETSKDNTHLVVIQAVLERDVFQDVATLVVERDRYKKTYVQVIGDPYIYGANYIIDPVYYSTPAIFTWFWASSYRPWYSPYYYGYYPRAYRYRNPLSINIYLTNINIHINHRHRFAYANQWRNPNAYKIYTNVSRNDYGTRYPDRTYSRRNVNVSNRYEMDKARNSDYVIRNAGSNNRPSSSPSQNNRVSNQSDRESANATRPSSSASSNTRETRPEVRKTDRAPENISREVKTTRQQTMQPSSSSQTRTVQTAPSSTQRSSSSNTTRSSSNSSSRSNSSNQRSEGGRR